MLLYGPEQVFGVASYDAYCQRVARGCVAHHVNQAVSHVSIPAYVSDGRWLCDCQACGNGIPIHNEWADARCEVCGTIYDTVAWPAAFASIEAVLVVRPVQNRNWRAPETVAMLQAENVAHGLPENG